MSSTLPSFTPWPPRVLAVLSAMSQVVSTRARGCHVRYCAPCRRALLLLTVGCFCCFCECSPGGCAFAACVSESFHCDDAGGNTGFYSCCWCVLYCIALHCIVLCDCRSVPSESGDPVSRASTAGRDLNYVLSASMTCTRESALFVTWSTRSWPHHHRPVPPVPVCGHRFCISLFLIKVQRLTACSVSAAADLCRTEVGGHTRDHVFQIFHEPSALM